MVINLYALDEEIHSNIRSYILDHFDADGYDEYAAVDVNDFEQVANAIYSCFRSEKPTRWGGIISSSFEDWCSGLPSILDCCYYCNRLASKDIALIFDIPVEKIKQILTEQQCEKIMTSLMYEEITKVVNFQ